MIKFHSRYFSIGRVLQVCAVLLFVAFGAIRLEIIDGLEAQNSGAVVVLSIDGPISPATDDYLKSGLAKASAQNAQLVVVKLNTPGGLLTSMQTMVEAILSSPIPIAVYVYPSGGGAISAGAFIAMAGHFAVMSPGTNIGAAHPVLSNGQDVQGNIGTKV